MSLLRARKETDFAHFPAPKLHTSISGVLHTTLYSRVSVVENGGLEVVEKVVLYSAYGVYLLHGYLDKDIYYIGTGAMFVDCSYFCSTRIKYECAGKIQRNTGSQSK